MNDQNPQHKAFLEIAQLLDKKYAYAEDVAQWIKAIKTIIDGLKDSIEAHKDAIGVMDSEMSSRHDAIVYELEDIKSSIDNKVSKIKSELGSNISSVKESLYGEVKKLYDLVENIPEPQEVDENAIIDKAVSKSKTEIVPLIKEQVEETGESIVEKINDLPLNDESLKIDASHIKNLPKQNAQHGGFARYIAGDNITIEGNVISATGGGPGSGSGYQAATGTVNGSNAVFSFSVAPNVLSVDGTIKQKVASDGTVNWTGTTTITLTEPPTWDIFAIS